MTMTLSQAAAVESVGAIEDIAVRQAGLLNLFALNNAQFSTACDQRDVLGKALDAANLLHRAEMLHQRTAMDEFRTLVRNTAIEVASDQDWCDEGLNEVLDSLSLDRKVSSYDVEVEVQVMVTRTITVRVDEVACEDEAKENIDDDVLREAMIEQGEWPEGDVHVDSYTVESVTDAD